MARSVRAQVHEWLDDRDARPAGTLGVEILVVGAVGANVAAALLETVPSIVTTHALQLKALELGALLVLAMEYAGRLWAAPEVEPEAGPWRARIRYAGSPLGLIDLVAVLPLCAGPFLPVGREWLYVVRLVSLLKLARYASALPLFWAVLRNEGRPLLAALLVLVILLVFNSGVMFVLEHEAQPVAFGSIPQAMWWAIVTMGTVGYGDVVPQTPAGKIFGGLVMVLGIAMFAVPAGLLATGFAVELRRRDFVVTWQTVARVPIFAGLDAVRIAEIARLLKRQIVPAKYAVVRRGETADAMFFIVAGEVEADVQPVPRRMGRGQFFGEIALLRDTVRTATVTAVTECELLTLEVADFRRLRDAHPDLARSIARVAEERIGPTTGSPPGGPPPGPPATPSS